MGDTAVLADPTCSTAGSLWRRFVDVGRLVVGFVAAAWISDQAAAGRERPDEHERHDYQVAEFRPIQLAVVHIRHDRITGP